MRNFYGNSFLKARGNNVAWNKMCSCILKLSLVWAFIFGIYTEGSSQCTCTDCRCSDSLELVKLYNSADGVNWVIPWNLSNPMTSWHGVILKNGRVTTLKVNAIQLAGTIPNINLPNLEVLNLSDNKLTGTIPNFNLPKLQILNFNNNQLTGTIPNLNLPNLTELILGFNQLSGAIPNFNSPNLIRLYINDNQLSDAIPNFNLPNLQKLGFSYNKLTGKIPNFNLPNLAYLYGCP